MPATTQVITVTHPSSVDKWIVILAAISAVMSKVDPIIIHILPKNEQGLASTIDTLAQTGLAVTVASLGAESTNTATPPVQ